jgi:hypothetical protein
LHEVEKLADVAPPVANTKECSFHGLSDKGACM